MKKYWMKDLVYVAILVFALVLVITLSYTATIAYNEGICPKCEAGQFHLVGTPTKQHPMYTYECDVCGNTIMCPIRLK